MSGRYARQTVLPEVGPEGQARLAGATVLVAGAGGLGCALLPYLAAAGVGRLVIVEPDSVDISNLHRQVLYRTSDVGRPKAAAAREALLALNPDVVVDAVGVALTPGTAPGLVRAADAVVDAADSFAVSYVLSDACQAAGRPLVSASVTGLAGYVGAFCGGAPSYRAVFPEMPRAAGNCAETGVLGTAVGVIGTLQAHLVLALLLDWQPPVLGRLFSVDLRTLQFGGFGFARAPEPAGPPLHFIAPGDVRPDDLVIDLRGPAELPPAPFPRVLRVTVDALERAEVAVPAAPRVVLCCRTGMRAWRAARALQVQGRTDVALIALGA